jgi:hypothetical protein
MESCRKVCRFREGMARSFLEVPWKSVLTEISSKAVEILDMSIPQVLVRAWKKYDLLSEGSPNAVKNVELVSHTVKSIHRPRSVISVDGIETCEIHFEIELSLAMHGIILMILNGRLKEISTGNCKGQLSIRCEDCLIIEKETRTIEFFKPLSLGKGFPLWPSDSEETLSAG